VLLRPPSHTDFCKNPRAGYGPGECFGASPFGSKEPTFVGGLVERFFEDSKNDRNTRVPGAGKQQGGTRRDDEKGTFTKSCVGREALQPS